MPARPKSGAPENPGDPRAAGHTLEGSDAFVRSGKVRDLFEIDHNLLLVASDRLSAFDVVLPTPIPDKGRVLTGLSRFWFAETSDLIHNHLMSTSPDSLPWKFTDEAGKRDLRGRMMICRKANVLPVEIIVRGYLAGSGWKEYQKTGSICGIELPPGLRESDQLRQPIFTPSTKAEAGHDQNISFDEMVKLVGGEIAERVRDVALDVYRRGADDAEEAGILLADTKFEMGTSVDTGELMLIDELMTPDSSRFWDAEKYEPGRPQDSYDKQPVRDWLETLDWDKTYPGPELPPEIVADTRRRYVTAFERITTASFERYLKEDVIAR
jgi:phosphoribosylaminoimidazole-succinocarboxamide synthase